MRFILWQRVLNNPNIWVISLLNLFVYVVRSGVFDWAAKFLVEKKGSTLLNAGFLSAGFEVAGAVGALVAGLASDRLSRGNRGPMCLLFMLLSAVGIGLLWWVPPGHPMWDAASLAFIGFAIYGPQFLVAIFVTDLASRKAAATAIGLTGIFGYAGSALSGVGTGLAVDHFGWGGGFVFWAAAALLGVIISIPLWRVSPQRA